MIGVQQRVPYVAMVPRLDWVEYGQGLRCEFMVHGGSGGLAYPGAGQAGSQIFGCII